ncbi:hypothetical protein MKQ68_08705 [Chitinophaga horti]|uniref:Uncharacterized protein n=1 Tax=Chitinophaga horti TaxID=2920382 RepID=A0ABY6J739_9BACT|nr:hypothetical protein [Chitinophaga horti]UYQ95176.1 hypothetical protein MKQ68_08705 [Chitinophaga horti]
MKRIPLLLAVAALSLSSFKNANPQSTPTVQKTQQLFALYYEWQGLLNIMTTYGTFALGVAVDFTYENYSVTNVITAVDQPHTTIVRSSTSGIYTTQHTYTPTGTSYSLNSAGTIASLSYSGTLYSERFYYMNGSKILVGSQTQNISYTPTVNSNIFPMP